MFEIIKNLFDLFIQFFNGIFSLKIEWKSGVEISVGVIVTAFIFFIFTIYIVYSMLYRKGGNE